MITLNPKKSASSAGLLFLLLSVIAGCNLLGPDTSGGGKHGTDGGSLFLQLKAISVEVGEQQSVPVTATRSDGTSDIFTVSCTNNCVDASVRGDAVVVTGVELGETTIDVATGSGLSKSLKVRVYDPMALMTDGLLITYVDQFTWEWNDHGSGASDNGSYWQPVIPPGSGYYALGSVAGDGWSDPSGVKAAIVVKEIDDSGALAPPTDYEFIWNDIDSDAHHEGSFWLPIAPPGYKALGVVAQNGRGKPDTDEVRCVRSDLVSNGRAGAWIWDDSGSGANYDFGSWEIDPPNAQNTAGKAYLKAGTFVGTNSWSAPTSHPALNVLNVHLPLVLDVPEESYIPSLDSADEPPLYTEAYVSKIVAVPFPLIYDAVHTLHEKVTSFPIYRVKREEFYEKAYYYNNLHGSTPIFHTVTTSTGISQTDSTTYSHSVGISITASMGCELIGGSVDVSVSYQFGYESSSAYSVFQEETVSQQVEIAPRTAGCLWHKTTRFSQLRNSNDWETVAGSVKDVRISSFVKGEYP